MRHRVTLTDGTVYEEAAGFHVTHPGQEGSEGRPAVRAKRASKRSPAVEAQPAVEARPHLPRTVEFLTPVGAVRHMESELASIEPPLREGDLT